MPTCIQCVHIQCRLGAQGSWGGGLGGQGRNNVPMKIPSNSCATCPDSVADLRQYLCLPLYKVVCGNLWLRQQKHPWPFRKMTLSRVVQQEHYHFSQNGYVKLYKVLMHLCWLPTNRYKAHHSDTGHQRNDVFHTLGLHTCLPTMLYKQV